MPFGEAVPAAAIGVATAAGGIGGKRRQPFRQRDNAGQCPGLSRLAQRWQRVVVCPGALSCNGPIVRACDVELVRAEFYRAYPADGTEQQRSEVRRKQFKRSIRDAVERSLVVTREIGARQWIWFAELEPAAAHIRPPFFS